MVLYHTYICRYIVHRYVVYLKFRCIKICINAFCWQVYPSERHGIRNSSAARHYEVYVLWFIQQYLNSITWRKHAFVKSWKVGDNGNEQFLISQDIRWLYQKKKLVMRRDIREARSTLYQILWHRTKRQDFKLSA